MAPQGLTGFSRHTSVAEMQDTPSNYALDFWCKYVGQTIIVTLFSDGYFKHFVSVDDNPVTAPSVRSPHVFLPQDITLQEALEAVKHNLENRCGEVELLTFRWDVTDGYVQMSEPPQ